MITQSKFQVGQDVQIIGGKHNGKVGVVTECKGTLYLGWRYRVSVSQKSYFVSEEYLKTL